MSATIRGWDRLEYCIIDHRRRGSVSGSRISRRGAYNPATHAIETRRWPNQCGFLDFSGPPFHWRRFGATTGCLNLGDRRGIFHALPRRAVRFPSVSINAFSLCCALCLSLGGLLRPGVVRCKPNKPPRCRSPEPSLTRQRRPTDIPAPVTDNWAAPLGRVDASDGKGFIVVAAGGRLDTAVAARTLWISGAARVSIQRERVEPGPCHQAAH